MAGVRPRRDNNLGSIGANLLHSLGPQSRGEFLDRMILFTRINKVYMSGLLPCLVPLHRRASDSQQLPASLGRARVEERFRHLPC